MRDLVSHVRSFLTGIKTTLDHDVAAQVEKDQARLDELAGLYAEGAISAREWITARDPIVARIAQGRRDIAVATDTIAVYKLVGTGGKLRQQWHGLDIDRQQAILKSALDHAVIAPGNPRRPQPGYQPRATPLAHLTLPAFAVWADGGRGLVHGGFPWWAARLCLVW